LGLRYLRLQHRREENAVGIDVSILFAPVKIDPSLLMQVAESTFSKDPPSNLVILFSDQSSAPPAVKRCFEEFTVASLWGDGDEGLPEFARALSEKVDTKIVALTICDHACVGGWQVFSEGLAEESYWTADDPHADYTGCSINAFSIAYGVTLKPSRQERLHFVDAFLQSGKGFCVYSATPALPSGMSLSQQQMQQVLEDDVSKASFECFLMLH
jgi:hypothetical protein